VYGLMLTGYSFKRGNCISVSTSEQPGKIIDREAYLAPVSKSNSRGSGGSKSYHRERYADNLQNVCNRTLVFESFLPPPASRVANFHQCGASAVGRSKHSDVYAVTRLSSNVVLYGDR
jgi:hypothetical protein